MLIYSVHLRGLVTSRLLLSVGVLIVNCFVSYAFTNMYKEFRLIINDVL